MLGGSWPGMTSSRMLCTRSWSQGPWRPPADSAFDTQAPAGYTPPAYMFAGEEIPPQVAKDWLRQHGVYDENMQLAQMLRQYVILQAIDRLPVWQEGECFRQLLDIAEEARLQDALCWMKAWDNEWYLGDGSVQERQVPRIAVRAQLLTEAHEAPAHALADQVYQHPQGQLYWANMQANCAEVIGQCLECCKERT